MISMIGEREGMEWGIDGQTKDVLECDGKKAGI